MKRIRHLAAALGTLSIAACAYAAPGDFQGEYKGTYTQSPTQSMPCDVKVIATGSKTFRIMVEARDPSGKLQGNTVELDGDAFRNSVTVSGTSGGRDWNGFIEGDTITVDDDYYGGQFTAKKIESKSPTAGTPPPKDAIVLLPFKEGTPPDLSEWTNQEWVPQDDGSVLVKKGSSTTTRAFGDCKLHVEFKVPLMPNHRGQARGNSGIIFCENYEIQVLDTFGVFPSAGDAGSIYNQAAASVNAALPPGTWQAYDIEFRAARLNPDGSVKELPRFVSVVWNGVKIHDNVEIKSPTGKPADTPHVGPGPLLLQDHSDPVQYRNVWIVEK